jgi:hypothetical protein
MHNYGLAIVLIIVWMLQAYVNLVLTLCDPGDSVVMFVPYYFNAYMAFQMTGITDIVLGHSNPNTIHPDAGSPFLIPGCIAFILLAFDLILQNI